MLKGFRDFLLRGNVIDLAVAVVIGAAFTALVTKFSDAIIQPLINRIGTGPDSDHPALKVGIGAPGGPVSRKLAKPKTSASQRPGEQ